MEFNLREFLKETFLDNIGYKSDRDIKYAASKWLEKGTLFDEDVAEIIAAINEKNAEKIVEQENEINLPNE